MNPKSILEGVLLGIVVVLVAVGVTCLMDWFLPDRVNVQWVERDGQPCVVVKEVIRCRPK